MFTNRFSVSAKRVAIGFVLFCTLMLYVNVAFAETRYLSLWSGIIGSGHTTGEPGQCGGIAGTTRSMSSASSNVYYMETYSKLYSTAGSIHLLNRDIKGAFNTKATAEARVPWPDCYYNYQTTRHSWQSAFGTSGIRKNIFSSATGNSSTAQCWNGSNC